MDNIEDRAVKDTAVEHSIIDAAEIAARLSPEALERARRAYRAAYDAAVTTSFGVRAPNFCDFLVAEYDHDTLAQWQIETDIEPEGFEVAGIEPWNDEKFLHALGVSNA